MKITVLTLFPQMYDVLKVGIIGDALEKKLFSVDVVNIRDFSIDKHKHCDDYPYGGGAGMVMTCQPICDALKAVDPNHNALRIFLSPKGKTLRQDIVRRLSLAKDIVFLCGSYEGVDQRVIDNYIDCELSIGDYVLTSGDMAAIVTINAVARYIPGVLGSMDSLSEESFSENLLEYPQYTRPEEWEGYRVPDVLLSGNHAAVDKWRYDESVKITRALRPDLLEKK